LPWPCDTVASKQINAPSFSLSRSADLCGRTSSRGSFQFDPLLYNYLGLVSTSFKQTILLNANKSSDQNRSLYPSTLAAQREGTITALEQVRTGSGFVLSSPLPQTRQAAEAPSPFLLSQMAFILIQTRCKRRGALAFLDGVTR
jgi:hypothetical protein